MEWLFLFSVLCLLCKDSFTAPTMQQKEDPELTGGFAEGDMIFPAQQRNGLRSEVYRWPDRTVLYHFGGNIGRFCEKLTELVLIYCYI